MPSLRSDVCSDQNAESSYWGTGCVDSRSTAGNNFGIRMQLSLRVSQFCSPLKPVHPRKRAITCVATRTETGSTARRVFSSPHGVCLLRKSGSHFSADPYAICQYGVNGCSCWKGFVALGIPSNCGTEIACGRFATGHLGLRLPARGSPQRCSGYPPDGASVWAGYTCPVFRGVRIHAEGWIESGSPMG